jgi:O-acetyl-ADP-ribose deacetylase (regulator of RNase III)
MSDIHYVEGDATAPVGPGPKIIVHVCNDVGGWGKGFVVAISRRWPEPERAYRAWHRGELGIPFELGAVQLVEVAPALWVANLIGQHGLRAVHGVPPVRYDAIRAGLVTLRAHAQEHGASVHMPRIGCGLAGGRWEEMEPIIDAELAQQGVPVTVYDFVPA